MDLFLGFIPGVENVTDGGRTMERRESQDMGTMNVKKLLVRLAVPAVVAQVINLLK